MALTKGFLRPSGIGNKDIVRTGIVVGTVLSFFLYYLFYYFRETIRILTGYFGGKLNRIHPVSVSPQSKPQFLFKIA